MFRLSLIFLLAAFLALDLTGCAKRATIKPESVVDTPENHYRLGTRLIREGDMEAAGAEFNRAREMSPRFAPAYAGMSLVHALQGDFRRAHREVEKGLDYSPGNPNCLIARGRVFSLEKRGDDWLEKAISQFDRVLKSQPDNSEAQFFKGDACKAAYRFADAAAAYSLVVEKKDEWSAAANAEWELVQKIVRAAPSTEKGNEIALIPALSRADLAVLLLEEMKLKDVLASKLSTEAESGFRAPESEQLSAVAETHDFPAHDMGDHWAKHWIRDILDLGAMESYPDSTFRPEEKITRGEFAMVVQRVLVQTTHDKSLETKYFGETSHFSDVSSGHPAYNAIVLAVNRGIMRPNLDGSFGLMSSVSGADALLMIRDFQNVLRQTF
jgi:hypothetical protein